VDGGLSRKKMPAYQLNTIATLRHGAMLTPDGSLVEPWRNMVKSMASAAEAELGALFMNCQEGMIFKATLEDLGHIQPKIPVHCDNALKGCVGTLKDGYVCNVPLPRVTQIQSASPTRSHELIAPKIGTPLPGYLQVPI
jgi:hypothetical protein